MVQRFPDYGDDQLDREAQRLAGRPRRLPTRDGRPFRARAAGSGVARLPSLRWPAAFACERLAGVRHAFRPRDGRLYRARAAGWGAARLPSPRRAAVSRASGWLGCGTPSVPATAGVIRVWIRRRTASFARDGRPFAGTPSHPATGGRFARERLARVRHASVPAMAGGIRVWIRRRTASFVREAAAVCGARPPTPRRAAVLRASGWLGCGTPSLPAMAGGIRGWIRRRTASFAREAAAVCGARLPSPRRAANSPAPPGGALPALHRELLRIVNYLLSSVCRRHAACPGDAKIELHTLLEKNQG
jgi:hypothetical protein